MKKSTKKFYRKHIKALRLRAARVKKTLTKFKFKWIYAITALGVILVLFGGLTLIDQIMSQRTTVGITPPLKSSRVNLSKIKSSTPIISGYPVSVQIPSLDINVPVIPGYYYPKTQTWTLSLSDAQYATMTPQPNNLEGKTFIYGHYRPAVFAFLHHIALGASATVSTANGHTFYYQLKSINVVNPTNTADIFTYYGPPVLTVQTCTGLFFQNRELFNFTLVKVV